MNEKCRVLQVNIPTGPTDPICSQEHSFHIPSCYGDIIKPNNEDRNPYYYTLVTDHASLHCVTSYGAVLYMPLRLLDDQHLFPNAYLALRANHCGCGWI